MGLMTYLRNRAGLIVTVIGVAIFAFLLGDVISYGTPFWMKNQNKVGSINGEPIDYLHFNAQVDQTASQFMAQMGGVSPQIRSFAVQQVWSQLISRELLRRETERIGLIVGRDELNDMVAGTNPSQQIIQAFTNPETGVFDRSQLNTFLSRVSTDVTPEMRVQWEALLENIRNDRLNSKYYTLLNNCVYVTALEGRQEYAQRNSLANFKYLMLDYASVKDSEIQPTDADYKSYYNAHKADFRNPEETRTLEYVLFDARPTANDTAAARSAIGQLKAELIESTNDSLFVVTHSDTKYPFTYLRKGQLSPALDTVIFETPAGTTVGPFLSNGRFEIAKVVEAKFSPDSVTAAHILLNTLTEGGVDKAMAKADSIKGLLEKGDSFAALAIQFSTDEGSKINGGELGTFPRGRMVPEFEEAAFSGKPGQVVIVNSRFGTHIIRIEKQVGNSKIVKAAIVDKAINAGKATTDAAYAKANQFLGEAKSGNFAEVAAKQGLTTEKRERATAMETHFNGVDVPRELMRWAFGAKKGAISEDIFETDDYFVVVRLADVQPKGTLSLEAVKPQIELSVKNELKAKMLTQKLENALNGASSIDEASQKLGVSVLEAQNIVLANPVLPGIALEPAVVGTVFGLQPNALSKAIKGFEGVYAVQPVEFTNSTEPAPDEVDRQKQQLRTSQTQRSRNAIQQALQDRADIQDNRIRFY